MSADETAAPPSAQDAPPVVPAKPEKKPTDWWAELRGILWLVLGVLALHTFVVKPFYIPSESMMPGLLKGDQLLVTKYPYGWSWVSPSFHVLPEFHGRLFGRMPERGDVVIVTPPGHSRHSEDWIKRVIGLPGDTIRMEAGQLYLNGKPVPRTPHGTTAIPIDPNVPCPDQSGRYRAPGPDGKPYCRLPVFRETLPDGRSYDTIDEFPSPADDYGPVTVPAGHVFLMGDNRDDSADSRVALDQGGLGGPIPWENIGGRAELITFSSDGSWRWYNPLSWFQALRGGRAGTSLRTHPVHGK
jgi:signal peptidase I